MWKNRGALACPWSSQHVQLDANLESRFLAFLMSCFNWPLLSATSFLEPAPTWLDSRLHRDYFTAGYGICPTQHINLGYVFSTLCYSFLQGSRICIYISSALPVVILRKQVARAFSLTHATHSVRDRSDERHSPASLSWIRTCSSAHWTMTSNKLVCRLHLKPLDTLATCCHTPPWTLVQATPAICLSSCMYPCGTAGSDIRLSDL